MFLVISYRNALTEVFGRMWLARAFELLDQAARASLLGALHPSGLCKLSCAAIPSGAQLNPTETICTLPTNITGDGSIENSFSLGW